MAKSVTIQDFKTKWSGASLKERSASQEHFIDLCRALGMQTPAEADSEGAFYTSNLYNARPTWLDQAHQTLDRAVWTAYGWPEAPSDTDDETILQRLLSLNLERSSKG